MRDVATPTTRPGTPIRKRMKRREIPGGVRFITFSCERRMPLLAKPEAGRIFVRSLREARQRFTMELFAWVVMPEHVHMLVRPPNDVPLATILKSMKLSAAQRLLHQLRLQGDPLFGTIVRADGTPRVWQKGGGFDRNVRDVSEFAREVRYIHRNPVDRGLVETPDDWELSSSRWWTARHEARTQHPADLPCDDPPGGRSAWVAWKGFK